MTGQATPRPRPVRRAWRVAIVAVVGAALVAAVLVTFANVPEPLPAPPALAHDPVPAERIHWTIPAGCGVSAATLDALAPHAGIDEAGEGGSCKWTSQRGDRANFLNLDVGVIPLHAGPGVPGATEPGNSSVAAAMKAFDSARDEGHAIRPVTGLGDEAFLYDRDSSDSRSGQVEFRTDNVIIATGYRADAGLDGKLPSAARLRAGALRAATDAARRLGAPAAPKVAAPPTARPAVRTPPSPCTVVPSGLRERLLGDDDPDTAPGDADDSGGAPIPGARMEGCDLRTEDRELTVSVITGTAPTAIRDIGREYLRRHLEARAEQPISRTDERYFHALSGLGDQAFAAYLEESDGGADVRSPARVVARAGPALVAVTYGAVDSGYATEPLPRTEAVDGAYAAAVRVVAAVRP